jgi:hypothetical protein
LANHFIQIAYKNQDINVIHEKLMATDTWFTSIPISTSRESQDLRMARAQYTISSFLSSTIWQPFSSEKTLAQPELVAFLAEISSELAKSKHGNSSGRHEANVWGAITMRALHSLSAASLQRLGSNSLVSSHLTSTRANLVVDKVVSILSPLVTPSRESQLRSDLLAVVNKAISIWSLAQTGELQLTIYSALDRANWNEWRSSMFDPAVPASFNDKASPDALSSTHPRIFTLFPRIIASNISGNAEPPTDMPGSWQDSDQEPRIVETCIHPGVGLPEWSVLVVTGKHEEEMRSGLLLEERLKKEMERLSHELKATSGRIGAHSRSGSMVGTFSPPPSPTAQWLREGDRRKVFEDD